MLVTLSVYGGKFIRPSAHHFSSHYEDTVTRPSLRAALNADTTRQVRYPDFMDRSSPAAAVPTDRTNTILESALGMTGNGDSAPPKMAEQLAARIEVKIIDAGWPVGEVLGTETELLRRFNVSRAVFREAVRILENHGVASMRRGPGGGLVVRAPDSTLVARAASLYLDHAQVTSEHLFEARLGIELLTTANAARRIGEQGISRLRAELQAEIDERPDQVFEHSHSLHVTIADLGGNPALTLFARVLVTLTDQHGRPSYEALDTSDQREAMREDVHHAHSHIVDAIIAGDAGLAQHRMRRHLEAMYPHLR